MKTDGALRSDIHLLRAIVAALLVLTFAPRVANAQTQGPQTQGPMIVERVHSGFLVAPDFKITEVDGKTGGLAGGYGGWLTDNRLFIGGAGYWLANTSRDRRMAYGGLVLQWLSRADRPIGWSVKGLVGGGQATLATSVDRLVPLDLRGFPFGRLDDRALRPTLTSIRVRTQQGFFVAEPEADLLIRVTRHMRLTVGAGYRAVAAERGADDRLRGAVGTLGLQIGGGS
jgi:hypothetical protein